MNWSIYLISAIFLLLGMLALGFPIFIGFLVLNIIGVIVLMGPAGFGLFTNSIFETSTSSMLVTITIFVLMGEILFRSGTVEVLFESVDRIVGRLRGRLYLVVIALSTVFGALSGSAVAVAAMLGRSLLPMMEERGYDRSLSASTILSGASLAPIIPPSLLAILVGSMAKVSIAGLLIAGIVPGLILASLTLIYIYLRIIGKEDPKPLKNDPQEISIFRAFLNMCPFLIVIFSVMGLILLGVATPSESAATGVAGAVLVAAIFRRLSFRMLAEAVASAASISAVILIIVCSAKLFSQLLSFTGATRGLIALTSDLGYGPDVTFLVMMAIPFFLCMFIDWVAFMLLAIPIYQPIVDTMGYDPIWFWTIFLIIITIGSLTPPFGYTLFALKGAADQLSTSEVFSAAWPIVGIYLSGIFVFWLVPEFVTFLPWLLR